MSRRPNILFLFSDQHAQSVAGCYGDGIVATPNLDRLAASGVTFDNCYCPSPICLPSRMSMLTGREPNRQECWTNHDILPSGVPTFAHALGAAGYDTTLIGRLHSLGPDQLRGFSHREIGDHSTNWIGGRAHDLGVFDKANDPYRESLCNAGPGQSSYELHDRDVTDAAVNAIEAVGEGARDRPFAMMVGWLLPHAPFACAPDIYARYAGRVDRPRIGIPADEHPYYAWWRRDRGIEDATQDEIARTRTAYYGLVDTLDDMVGRVLAALDGAGLREDTLVVYASDHGEHAGNRGLWWKSTLYDEAAKVPLIVSWPNEIEAGARRENVCSLVDLTATIVDMAGAPALPRSDGRSLLPVLRDRQAPWLDQTFSEYVNDGAAAWSGGRVVVSRMIRHGRWKLIFHHGHSPQLFDLAADPDERHDLAGDPRHAAIRQSLTARVLAGWNPDAIALKQTDRREEHELLAEWARQTRPEDHHRWRLRADDNWLDTSARPSTRLTNT